MNSSRAWSRYTRGSSVRQKCSEPWKRRSTVQMHSIMIKLDKRFGKLGGRVLISVSKESAFLPLLTLLG